LERIVLTSSDEGDVVLDPFCGCGTAIAVAEKLNRRWIGIDITHLAVNLIKTRLRDHFGEAVQNRYDVRETRLHSSDWRTQCDHKPIIQRKRLDFAKNSKRSPRILYILGTFGGSVERPILLFAGSVFTRNPTWDRDYL
jgi:hypothetical protein